MIYFIYDSFNNALKIGVAENVEKRLASLQTGNPTRLTLKHVIDGSYEEELILHDYYRKHRLIGEWFTFTKELQQDLKNNIFGNIIERYNNDAEWCYTRVSTTDKLDNLFVKNKDAYIVVREIPEYLDKHGVMSLTGEKTLRATKIAKYFDVIIKQKRVNKKQERCIVGLDYAK